MQIQPVGRARGNVLKQFKKAQITGPRGPVGPDNPASDDLGLSPEFADPANLEGGGAEWELEDPNAPEHMRSDDFTDNVYEPQRMESLYRLLAAIYDVHDDHIAQGKSILKDKTLEEFLQDWELADPSKQNLFRKFFDHFDPTKTEERDRTKAEAFESQKADIYPSAYSEPYSEGRGHDPQGLMNY